MRFLVLSAIIACACAAPQYIAPLTAVPAARAIPAGDIEAVDIDAKVKADDVEQYTIDQAREQIEELKWRGLNNVQTSAARIGSSGISAATGFIAGGSISSGVIAGTAIPEAVPYPTGFIAGGSISSGVLAAKVIPGAGFASYPTPLSYLPFRSHLGPIPSFGHGYPVAVKNVW